jgi:gas vesicle protein
MDDFDKIVTHYLSVGFMSGVAVGFVAGVLFATAISR